MTVSAETSRKRGRKMEEGGGKTLKEGRKEEAPKQMWRGEEDEMMSKAGAETTVSNI